MKKRKKREPRTSRQQGRGEYRHFSWQRVVMPVIFMAVFSVLIIVQRIGVLYDGNTQTDPLGSLAYTDPVPEEEAECLLISDSSDQDSMTILPEVRHVLEDMRVPVMEADVSGLQLEQQLPGKKTVVIATSDWEKFKGQLYTLVRWVHGGGSVMAAMPPVPGSGSLSVRQQAGILDGGQSYTDISGIKASHEGILGASQKQVYLFSLQGETMKTSLDVQLYDNADVWFTSEDGKTPILWSSDYGDGKFVVLNDVISEKYQRGFYCIGYSLLQPACIWPVINASAYYLDDFPSPVPGGDSTYIQRDYGVDIATFYSQIWWPQMLEWEREYGIRHTGMIIEDYNDDVSAPFKTQKTTGRFMTFGNTLVYHGGELGLHGYNHQPLCISSIDEDMQFGSYKLWKSEKDAEEAVRELASFSKKTFPGQKLQVYVPPSNILSDTGKAALLKADPDIRVIASVYTNSADVQSYVQEFGMDEDGIIDAPRITSGTIIDDYMYLTAFSEMNYHFVQSHFCHPDDVLDPDRGAEKGWAYMAEHFEDYLKYMTKSAPDMEQTTGSEIGAQVARWSSLSVQREMKPGELELKLGGFSGEAWFLMRLNEDQAKITETSGCRTEEIADGLYLVHATSDTVRISYAG